MSIRYSRDYNIGGMAFVPVLAKWRDETSFKRDGNERKSMMLRTQHDLEEFTPAEGINKREIRVFRLGDRKSLVSQVEAIKAEELECSKNILANRCLVLFEGYFTITETQVFATHHNQGTGMMLAGLYTEDGDVIMLNFKDPKFGYYPLLVTEDRVDEWLDPEKPYTKELISTFIRLDGKEPEFLHSYEVAPLIKNVNEKSNKNIMRIDEYADFMKSEKGKGITYYKNLADKSKEVIYIPSAKKTALQNDSEGGDIIQDEEKAKSIRRSKPSSRSLKSTPKMDIETVREVSSKRKSTSRNSKKTSKNSLMVKNEKESKVPSIRNSKKDFPKMDTEGKGKSISKRKETPSPNSKKQNSPKSKAAKLSSAQEKRRVSPPRKEELASTASRLKNLAKSSKVSEKLPKVSSMKKKVVASKSNSKVDPPKEKRTKKSGK